MAETVEAQSRALHPSISILPIQIFAAGLVGPGLAMALHRILQVSRVGRLCAIRLVTPVALACNMGLGM